MNRVPIYKCIRYLNSKSRWKRIKKETNSCPKHAVLFLGDSITEGCDLKHYYPMFETVNRGIHSESTDFIYGRLDFSVYELEPKVVVLLAGINDMIIDEKSSDEIVVSYQRLLEGIRRNDERIRIIVQSIYPTRDGTIFQIRHLNKQICDTNKKIKKLCEEMECIYVDIHKLLLNESGELDSAYNEDGCHPNDKAYEMISKVIRPLIETEVKKYESNHLENINETDGK